MYLSRDCSKTTRPSYIFRPPTRPVIITRAGIRYSVFSTVIDFPHGVRTPGKRRRRRYEFPMDIRGPTSVERRGSSPILRPSVSRPRHEVRVPSVSRILRPPDRPSSPERSVTHPSGRRSALLLFFVSRNPSRLGRPSRESLSPVRTRTRTN